MHIAFIIFVSVLIGYGAGLGFEVLADGNDSKIQRLINENEVDPNWIPFGIVGKMYHSQDIADSAYLEYYGTPGLIGVGHLDDDQSPISAATVAFDVGIRAVQNNGKTSFQNVVNMCIFHSPQSFDQLCLICKLVDDSGEEDVLVGGGLLVEDREYMGSDIEEIEVFSIPEVEPGMLAANDVQDVSKVQLEICGVAGCTPGFWKNNFEHWELTGFSPGDLFVVAFMITEADGTTVILQPQFDVLDAAGLSGITLGEAIALKGDELKSLLRHATAGLLNLSADEVIYLLNIDLVKSTLQDGLVGDTEAAKDRFEEANEAFCPLAADESGKILDKDEKDGSQKGGKK